MRIKERNRRETEKILRDVADYETELQEEMFREFDQSTFNLDLEAFNNTPFPTFNYVSDYSQVDSDPSFYLSNVVTNPDSPFSRPKLKSISGRIKTPIRVNNRLAGVTAIDYE